jgi:hypothetical protein
MLGDRGLIAERDRDFPSSPDRLYYPNGVRDCIPGCKADQSTAPSAEVKNAWSYTCTPPIRLHGMMLN